MRSSKTTKQRQKRSQPYRKKERNIAKEDDLDLRDTVDADLQTILHGAVQERITRNASPAPKDTKHQHFHKRLAETIQQQAETREKTRQKVDETIDELADLMSNTKETLKK